MLPQDQKLGDRVVTSHISPHDASINNELHRAVAQLEPKYRAVISLFYWHGYSVDEIAYVMQRPSGSVKGWMSRAKEQLRKELA